jgi:GTP cyclohydrolase I
VTEMLRNKSPERAVEMMGEVLSSLGFDWEGDPNMRDTPQRWVRMMLNEACAGCYTEPPKITAFPNDGFDQLYIIGPMTVRSMCSHHLLPVVGKAWVCVLPGDKLVGLSKFARLCDWVMRRPTMQEAATNQLADAIEELCAPRAVAVTVDASHMCMTYRGVQHENARMVTSVMRGEFLTKPSLKAEALQLMRQQQGAAT